MSNRTNVKNSGRIQPSDEQSLGDQLRMMHRAFMASPLRNKIIWLSITIVVVIVVTAFGQIILNR